MDSGSEDPQSWGLRETSGNAQGGQSLLYKTKMVMERRQREKRERESRGQREVERECQYWSNPTGCGAIRCDDEQRT